MTEADEATGDAGRGRHWVLVSGLIGLLVVLALAIGSIRRSPWQGPGITQSEVDLSDAVAEVREAIEAARTRVVSQPDSGTAWGELAMLLRAHGFDLPADAAFRRAEELDRDEFRWPYLLGVSLENVDPLEAERCLKRAIRLAPDSALPRLSLAEMLADLGREQEAERLFRDASQLDSLNTRPLLGLARLKLAEGELADAEGLCRQVEEIEPEGRMVQELLARVLYRQGRQAEAERVRRRLETMPQVETSNDPYVAEVLILRRDPNWIAVKAQTMLEQGQTQRAVEYLESVITEHPGRVRFPLQLARALGGVGQAGRAREVLRQAIVDFPDSAELRLVQGLVLGELKEIDAAIESFKAAIQRKPDYAEAWLWQGRALRDRGAAGRAERCFRQAIRFRPDLPDAHAALGELLLGSGGAAGLAEAARELETAVDLAPGNVQWRSRLAEARRRLEK
jgi:tetratricopeptide (TPR) repeat protein